MLGQASAIVRHPERKGPTLVQAMHGAVCLHAFPARSCAAESG